MREALERAIESDRRAGEMGVVGENGTEEVFRSVSGRCFGKKHPKSAPVNG